jgi:hypothetical protein
MDLFLEGCFESDMVDSTRPRRLMAKPVLLVTRKLPEAIEARAAQDYDALLNPQDAPWATHGAKSPAARRKPAPPASWGLPGITSIPSASMPCRLAW